MATATFIGPRATMTFSGLTFVQGEARPVPDAVVDALRTHPWFSVDADEAGAEDGDGEETSNEENEADASA